MHILSFVKSLPKVILLILKGLFYIACYDLHQKTTSGRYTLAIDKGAIKKDAIDKKTIDEGVIKFDDSNYQLTPALSLLDIQHINPARSQLYQLELIGQYTDLNVGYGNISQRKDFQSLHKSDKPQFIISGSQTGHLSVLNGEHYTRVVDYDLAKNKVCAMGPRTHIKGASSESLSHAAIYECNPAIGAVIHIHNRKIWQGMLNDNLTHTHKDIPYGTVLMANAVKEKVAGKASGYLAMAGHEDGVITYGENFEQAMEICLGLYERYSKN